ncbi:aminopeptidase P N-terminal domain-containing protein [Candidatus Kinetoplastidibacterium crithidiae]|uniref:Xaa-Pro aminopeptidase n=1 Tax=Candidatus Kinetoplastidibacterium crithidiae TCC036E TaxID=1208918 RepID=M1LX89_9PROT|nr:aminopeptidase P N-terminal domain-containing protein [Candidatus Kinetoplastibacterium crithidii]AFZ82520.1 Xaa-Pro aminopeptidase [Candidatus Kinetoplastibacterium crithidii (ex Angomonas deanei ATCC 30255)]AGF47819.1 X-Pro aminopeptidase [Candidatus Kinetoplastibacterium crithidii TCC036E]
MKTISVTQFQKRRETLIKKINELGGGIIIIPNAKKFYRNNDNEFQYRHDSNFYYLSGFTEPNSCIVLVAGKQNKSFLFCLPKNKNNEMWTGEVYGNEVAGRVFKFDYAYPIEKFDIVISDIINNLSINSIYIEMNKYIGQKNKIFDSINEQIKTTNKIKHICDLSDIVSEMRLIKDNSEIKTMKLAAQISAEAHLDLLKYCKIGMYEYELESRISYNFRKQGAQSISYNSIVASGKNSCTLHYIKNNQKIKNGDLILVDAGCELNSYASDITRTFPANGKFSPSQLAIYNIVLEAQKTAIDSCKTGNSFNDPHQAALKILIQGLLDEKILVGDKDEIIENQKYKEFYPHSTSHWIGLDVHDVGSYYSSSEDNIKNWTKLKPGMLLTIEPGLYIRQSNNIPSHFWNIGIRIEDTILIKTNECEIITKNVPVKAHEIEKIMKDSIII